MATLENRYDFVLLYDVINGNPNGDPDAGNAPRIDPETGHGLVSDVCLKRKIRDFVSLAKTKNGVPEKGYDIYVSIGAVLNAQHDRAYEAEGLKKEEGKKTAGMVDKARAWMCQTFFDIRAFGAVMTTGTNCGQVRGPVQLAFSRSIDPIVSLEQTITRKAVTKQEDADKQIAKDGSITGTMGRKEIVPYCVFRQRHMQPIPAGALWRGRRRRLLSYRERPVPGAGSGRAIGACTAAMRSTRGNVRSCHCRGGIYDSGHGQTGKLTRAVAAGASGSWR